jgi:hypothetical protein
VLVAPVVRSSLDRRLRVVLELVEDGGGGVAGDLGRPDPDELVGKQVLGGEALVGMARVRPEVHSREGVVGDEGGDVGPRHDGVDHRSYLGLRGGIGAGSGLLVLGRPFHREVAVEVQPLERLRRPHRDPVVALQDALGKDAIEAVL